MAANDNTKTGTPKGDGNPDQAGGRAERAGANATAGRNESNSTETVTIGCKLPHGLILDLTIPGQTPRRVRIRGRNAARVIGGYGMTPGVPKAFWEEWRKKNAALAFVKNDLIFAEADRASAVDHAKDNERLTTGLEAIDPNNPGKGIQKADDTPAGADSTGDVDFDDEV
jgi:hypothetical protein